MVFGITLSLVRVCIHFCNFDTLFGQWIDMFIPCDFDIILVSTAVKFVYVLTLNIHCVILHYTFVLKTCLQHPDANLWKRENHAGSSGQ